MKSSNNFNLFSISQQKYAKAQMDNEQEAKFWEPVMIGVVTDPTTNRLCAGVLVNVDPPNLKYLRQVYEKMRLKIYKRKTSPLKDKVIFTTRWKEQDEILEKYGNYVFFIELNDNSMTKETFEAYLNSLKTTRAESAKHRKELIYTKFAKRDFSSLNDNQPTISKHEIEISDTPAAEEQSILEYTKKRKTGMDEQVTVKTNIEVQIDETAKEQEINPEIESKEESFDFQFLSMFNHTPPHETNDSDFTFYENDELYFGNF